jgi:hypothetical protein
MARKKVIKEHTVVSAPPVYMLKADQRLMDSMYLSEDGVEAIALERKEGL